MKSQEKMGLFYTEDNNFFENSKCVSQEKFVSNINNADFNFEKKVEKMKPEEKIEQNV